MSLSRRIVILAVGAVAIGAAVAGGVWVLRRSAAYVQDYEPQKNTLYRGLQSNDFGAAYANDADLAFLKGEFAFLAEAETETDRVVALVRWLNTNVRDDEAYTVSARKIYELRRGACEVHALAVAVLEAFGTKARWICSARSSMGFGYLEAFVDGHWALFRLRSAGQIEVGKSAWELFNESEPSLAIRTFWSKPGQSTATFEGTVYPAIFPLANARVHEALRTLFQTPRGIVVAYGDVNPHDFLFEYRVKADAEWVTAGTVPEEFAAILRSGTMRRRRFYGAVADWMGWTSLASTPF